MARFIERPMHTRPPALFHIDPHQVGTAGGDGRRVGPPRTASIGHRLPLSAGVLGPSPPFPLPPPRAHQRVAPSHFEEGLEPERGEPQSQLSPGISERTSILHRPKCGPFSGVGSGEPSGAFSERQHLSRVQNPRQLQALRRTTGCALIALQMESHIFGLGSAHGRRGIRVHSRDDPTYRGIPLPIEGRDPAHCDAHPKCDRRV